MGKAIELLTVQADAPGEGASFLAVAGNSLTIRDSNKPVWLGPVWQSRQSAGFIRMTSPLLHDSSVGIQMQAPAGQTVTLAQDLQRLYPQDTLSIFGSGSLVAGILEQSSWLVMYEDLPGVDANLIDVAELSRRGEAIYSFPLTIVADVLGGYSGATVITAESDQLRANREYAIVGYDLTTACAAVRYLSHDWGNLGIGGPGPVGATSGAMETRTWFRDVSEKWGMPAIPVFNASNKSQVFVDVAQNQLGADPTITTVCVLLSPRGNRR